MTMAENGGGYSRLVGVLKILLPLAALGLLSTVFLFSRSEQVTFAEPPTGVTTDTDLPQSGISNPRFVGSGEGNITLSLNAERAVPIAEGDVAFHIDDPHAAVTDDGEEIVRIVAKTADIGRDDAPSSFSGGAELWTRGDWQITADAVSLAADLNAVQATGGVTASAPMGSISAETAEILRQTDAAGQSTFRLLFNDRVKLIYYPEH